MKVTSKINIDLRHPNPGVRVDAVQGDVNTRAVEISLFDGGSAWKVPSGVTAALAYKKPDSQQGCLDGSASVTVSGSTITIVMTKQMLSAPGTVNACVVLTDASKNQLTAFPFSVSVAANPAADVQQSDEPIKVDTSDATAAAGDILSGKTAYVNGKKVTGSIASRSAQAITPGTSDQTIASGQYLSGKQTIKGDANLLPGNIKSGVTVFGVDGAYVGTVDIDTSDATAVAADILAGKTAYVNGKKVTGSIASRSAQTITPGKADQTIASGQYLSGKQTIKGDANLLPGNIKSGVSIFGVAGTLEATVAGAGLSVKTGETTSAVFDVGLSELKALLLYTATKDRVGLVNAAYIAGSEKGIVSGISAYSYVTSFAFYSDTYKYFTFADGTVTWSTGENSRSFVEGNTYTWVAVGIE